MKLAELHDWLTSYDEDPLYRWQRLLEAPDPDLPHPALLRKPQRRSIFRYAGKPNRFTLVARMLRTHTAWAILEKRGEHHVPQTGPVRDTQLALVRRREA